MINELRELRARHPELIAEKAAKRVRRPLLRDDGRLMLIAADHPARGSLGRGDDATAMADREDLLNRLMTALSNPKTDGVLATADIVEDLLLLGALEDKVVFGSMNRGGLRGSVFGMDDRFTGYDAATIAQMNLDGGKMLVRIDLDDPGTVRTLESAGHAVTDLAALGKTVLIEPFITRQGINDLSPGAVIRSAAIASGLGATSAYTWLKLPVTEDMERVVMATTLPVLVLGGDKADALSQLREGAWVPGVGGLAAGRSLLYPVSGTVEEAVATACDLVHA
jgi:DhnA family fructose-bisphosphate aldolase class Ia